MSCRKTQRVWQPALLTLALVAGCGGSASHHEPGAEGGATTDPLPTAGENGLSGGGAAAAGVGNGTSGGASGGGGAQGLGGSAGGAGPQITLPPGCRPRTPMESEGSCSLAVDCDAESSVRTYCYRLPSGQWDCQCANQENMYRLENAAGLQACALAAQLCAAKDLELGEESCVHEEERSDETSCAVDIACGSPVELGATMEAKAWLMRFGWGRCSGPGTAKSLSCACSDGTTTSNHELVADNIESACGALADFCMSGETPVFEGEEACLPSLFSSDSDGCQRFASCGPLMPLTDDVSLGRFKQRFASCVPKAGGGSECSCSNDDSAFQFRLSTAPDDAACEAAIPNCDPNAEFERVGEATCEPPSVESFGDDMCQAFLSCVQNATVEDRSLAAQGTLSLICRRVEEGKPWSCSCASGPDTARFELGAAGADASEACTQASASCVQRLGVHLGPAGDSMGPPDPFF